MGENMDEHLICWYYQFEELVLVHSTDGKYYWHRLNRVQQKLAVSAYAYYIDMDTIYTKDACLPLRFLYG
jgi:hypothetical protein